MIDDDTDPLAAYDEELRMLFGYALLGLRDSEIAMQLEMDTGDFKLWLKEQPMRKTAIKRGRIDADAEVAASLFSEATKGKNVTAMNNWLSNRQKKRWGNNSEGGGINYNDNRTILQLTPEQAYMKMIEGVDITDAQIVEESQPQSQPERIEHHESKPKQAADKPRGAGDCREWIETDN